MNFSHIKKTVYAGRRREIIKYYSRRLGATGNGAEKKRGQQSVEMAEYHWGEAEDKIRWLLCENFTRDDLFMRFSLPAGARMEREEIAKILKEFMRKLKREYQKRGRELKYIYTAGLGMRGGLHFHMVLSQMDSAVVERVWQNVAGTAECPYPSTNTKHLYSEETFGKLAKYLIDNSKESTRLSVFRQKYCRSRNLREPEIRREVVKSPTWREVPKIPKGWKLLGEVENGLTVAGYPFQRYTLITDGESEINEPRGRGGGGKHERQGIKQNRKRKG